MMAGHDPCQALYDALGRANCDPRGPVYKFVARCPAHEDRRASLSACEGVDRRAVMCCHAGCDTAAVLRALGLSWSDLFPGGHHRAPASRQPRVETERVVIGVLVSLSRAGVGWRRTKSVDLYVADRCPKCDAESLWIADLGATVRLSCWRSGCESDEILTELARQAIHGEAVVA